MPFLEAVLDRLPAQASLPQLALTLSILQELRTLLRSPEQQTQYALWCIAHLAPLHEQALRDELDASVKKTLLFFLLQLHDSAVERFVDSHYGAVTLAAVAAFPSEAQELAALRYAQTHITADHFETEIDAILSGVFDNRNMNFITPLSALDDDRVLAYLLRVVARRNTNLYTQNIIYWLKHFAMNISLRHARCILDPTRSLGRSVRRWSRTMRSSSWLRSVRGSS